MAAIIIHQITISAFDPAESDANAAALGVNEKCEEDEPFLLTISGPMVVLMWVEARITALCNGELETEV